MPRWGLVLLLAGCAPGPESDLPLREGATEYAYAAVGRSGKELASGVLALPELVPGDYALKGSWRVKATGPSEDPSGIDLAYQDGSGRLIGTVRGRRVVLHFHPDTLGTDREFNLTGTLTDDGAAGTWEFVTEAGPSGDRGRFTLRRRDR